MRLVHTKVLRCGLESLRGRAEDIGRIELWRERGLCGGFAFEEEQEFLTWVAQDHGVDVHTIGTVTHIHPRNELFVRRLIEGEICEHYLIDSDPQAQRAFTIGLFCTGMHWETELLKEALAA